MKNIARGASSIEWVQYASKVHKIIHDKKQDISKHFPNKEYLHPIELASEKIQRKMNKLFLINIDDFISITQIEH